MLDLKGRRVLVTGGAGFLGRALCARLKDLGVAELVVPRRLEQDLTRHSEVVRLYENHRPEVVFHLAAEVGGIGANREHPGRFFFANMAMGLHLIEEGRLRGVKKFIQAGTICAYPKFSPLPFRESDLWNGYPEETNAPYGIAKKALQVMLASYRAEYGFNGVYVLPVNLYGPGDNFHPQTSHVIPALIRKCLEAVEAGSSQVEIWGTGRAGREFLYVDDCVEGLLLAAQHLEDSHPVNLGTGSEILITDLADMVARLSGFKGELKFNSGQPDGQPRRCLDVSLAERKLGFKARVGLEEGLKKTVDWFRQAMQRGEIREVSYG